MEFFKSCLWFLFDIILVAYQLTVAGILAASLLGTSVHCVPVLSETVNETVVSLSNTSIASLNVTTVPTNSTNSVLVAINTPSNLPVSVAYDEGVCVKPVIARSVSSFKNAGHYLCDIPQQWCKWMCCSGGYTGIGTLQGCYRDCQKDWDACIEWRKSNDRNERRKEQREKEERQRKQQWKDDMDERKKNWEKAHPPTLHFTQVMKSSVHHKGNTPPADAMRKDECVRKGDRCLKRCKDPKQPLFCEALCAYDLQECQKRREHASSKAVDDNIEPRSLEARKALGDTHCEFQRVKCAQKCSHHIAIINSVFKHMNIFCSNRCDRQYWGCLNKEHHKNDKDWDDVIKKRSSGTKLDKKSLKSASGARSMKLEARSQICGMARETCIMRCKYFIFGCEKKCTKEFETCLNINKPGARPTEPTEPTELPAPRQSETTYVSQTATPEHVQKSDTSKIKSRGIASHTRAGINPSPVESSSEAAYCTRVKATCVLDCIYFGLMCHKNCSAVYETCLDVRKPQARQSGFSGPGETVVPGVVEHAHSANIAPSTDTSSDSQSCAIDHASCKVRCTHFFFTCKQTCYYIYKACIHQDSDSATIDLPQNSVQAKAASLETLSASNSQPEKRDPGTVPQSGRDCDEEKRSYIAQCVSRKVASSPLPPKGKDGAEYAREAAKHAAKESADWQCEARSHQPHQRCLDSIRRSSKSSFHARSESSASFKLVEDCWAEEDYCIHECEGGTDMEIQGCRWRCKDDYKRCLDEQAGKSFQISVERSVANHPEKREIMSSAADPWEFMCMSKRNTCIVIATEDMDISKKFDAAMADDSKLNEWRDAVRRCESAFKGCKTLRSQSSGGSTSKSITKRSPEVLYGINDGSWRMMCVLKKDECLTACAADRRKLPWEFRECMKNCVHLYDGCIDISPPVESFHGIVQRDLASRSSAGQDLPTSCLIFRDKCDAFCNASVPWTTEHTFQICSNQCDTLYRKCEENRLSRNPSRRSIVKEVRDKSETKENETASPVSLAARSSSHEPPINCNTIRQECIKIRCEVGPKKPDGERRLCLSECKWYYRDQCLKGTMGRPPHHVNGGSLIRKSMIGKTHKDAIEREMRQYDILTEQYQFIPGEDMIRVNGKLDSCMIKCYVCPWYNRNCQINTHYQSCIKKKCNKFQQTRSTIPSNQPLLNSELLPEESIELPKQDIELEKRKTDESSSSSSCWQNQKVCLSKCLRSDLPCKRQCMLQRTTCVQRIDRSQGISDEVGDQTALDAGTGISKVEGRDVEDEKLASSKRTLESVDDTCAEARKTCDKKCQRFPFTRTPNNDAYVKVCKHSCAETEKRCLKGEGHPNISLSMKSIVNSIASEEATQDESMIERRSPNPAYPWVKYEENTWCYDIANHCNYACERFKFAHERIGQSESECRISCRRQFKTCVTRDIDGFQSIFPKQKKGGKRSSEAVVERKVASKHERGPVSLRCERLTI